MDFKAFIAWLFTPEPPQPIADLEDKRKAVERFCLAQNHNCGRCNIASNLCESYCGSIHAHHCC